jgi:hypothetical protein
VNDWTPVFLGTIALAVLVMAIVQVGAIIYGARLAQRVDRLADAVEREVQPLFANLNRVGAEAARATTLAALQVERADRLLTDVGQRVEKTASLVQHAVVAPAREGLALVTGIRAAAAALREIRDASKHPRPSARPDEDDPLFIG